MIVYFNGSYLEKSQVSISPQDRGFLLADGIYDVIKAYHGRFFLLNEHLTRLSRGLQELKIEGCDVQFLGPIALRLLQENQLLENEATVYIQVTRGSAPRSHHFPPAGTAPTIYLEPRPYSPPLVLREKGATAIIVPDDRWSRCDIKTIGLLPNVLANERAHEVGAFEALFSRQGILLEGSHSSFIFVRHDRIVAPPLNNLILPGVTRNVVLSLAATAGIPVETRPCLESELSQFTEVMMIGTTVEIVPIIAINGSRIGSGTPGPITRRLQQLFQNAIHEHGSSLTDRRVACPP
jgi:D-alanine transaminase